MRTRFAGEGYEYIQGSSRLSEAQKICKLQSTDYKVETFQICPAEANFTPKAERIYILSL